MKRTSWKSTPIINCVFEWTSEEMRVFQAEMMAVQRAPREIALNAYKRDEKIKSTVDFFKFCLGQQAYTWIGEYRFWVWERDDWRVYVSNTKGICIEVREGLSKLQVRVAWDDFRARIGIHCLYPVGARVLAYSDDEPGVSKGPDDDHPGHVLVRLGDCKNTSVHMDNLRPA